MGSEPYLKEFVRAGGVEARSQSRRSTDINQEKVDEVNDFLQTHPESSVRSVAEISSILQTTITYRIVTGHLLLKSYTVEFVQQLCKKDFQDCVKCRCHY